MRQPQPTVVPAQPPRAALVALAAVLAIVVALVSWRRVGSPETGPHAGVVTGAQTKRSPAPLRASLRPKAGIAGHVLDLEGKPVAGAQVCAWATQSKQLSTKEIAAPRCTRSSAEGSYGLADLFPATPLVVSASAEGFAPVGYRAPDGTGELRLGDGERRTAVDLRFTKAGVALKGSVNDITGGAIARALVTSDDGPDRAVGLSDDKGEFTLWVEPGSVHVEATASGYAPGRQYGIAPEHFFKIQLVPGATLVGRTVVAGSETPVPGVFVEGIQMEGGWQRASSLSDDEGRFRVEGLRPGRYRVEATSDGREGYSTMSTPLGIGETSSEIVVEMDPAFVVRGKVVEKGTGAPCKSGQVTITDTAQSEYSQANVEPDGSVRMASVLPGKYHVEVKCEGHLDRDDFANITVDKDLPPFTWEVDKGASVRVEIVEPHGSAVTKATVYAFPSQPDGVTGSTSHAEGDGTFVVGGLKKGTYSVQVRSDDGARADKEVTVSVEREERIKVELTPACVVDGVVEDEGHRPVGGIPIVAQSTEGRGRAFGRSNEDGTFTLRGLAPGDYTVRANDDRSRKAAAAAGDNGSDPTAVKLSLAGPEHAKVRITVEARNGTITGRVVDGSDKPVTDAFIDSFPQSEGQSMPRYADGSRAPVLTDTDGRFTIEGLSDGEYALRAYRQGGNEATAEHLKVGARDVVLKLDGGGSIAGTLVSNGAPIERFQVTATNTATQFSRSELFFHAGGGFAIGDLPAGTYKLVAETPGGRASTEVTLAAGEQKTGVALTLTLRGTVIGTVVSLETGAPMAGVQVRIDGASDGAIMGGDSSSARPSGPDGRFRLEFILPGSWNIVATPSGSNAEPGSQPVVVQEGGGVTDVGTIRVVAPRVAPGDARGNLGVVANGPADAPLQVQYASPAAIEAGIQVGDVILSVDGYDVQGANRYLFSGLTTVATGRTVAFGLARGATVNVTAQ